jgi:Putative DnaT-like ssDNA binding protein
MPIIVADGTEAVAATANSYASEDDFDTYTEDRNYTVTVGDTEAALIRASQSLDATYRKRYPGTKAYGRDQILEWPRQDATDAYDDEIAIDEIPQEIIDATCEFTLRELNSPGSTMPDLDRGGDIHRLKAGSVEIEYGAAAKVKTTFSIVDGILSGLIGGPGSGLTAITVRS